MRTRTFDRVMTVNTALWLLIVIVSLLLAIWEATTWARFGQITASASIAWLAVALLFGYLASRAQRPAPRAPETRVFK